MTTHPRYTRIKTHWFYALASYKTCEGVFAIVFPLFLFNALHLSISTVGALTGLISFGAVLDSMFWGYVSDHYRIRRAFIVLGCLLGGPHHSSAQATGKPSPPGFWRPGDFVLGSWRLD